MTISGVIRLAVAVVATIGVAWGEPMKVISVHDGDTLTALAPGDRQIKIRLGGIDAPELGQAFGQVARKGLAEAVHGRTVDVETVERDRYGRTVARVRLGDRDINRELVANGLAWRYPQFDKAGGLIEPEASARAARRGLWHDAQPVAPWAWRATERERKASRKALGAGGR